MNSALFGTSKTFLSGSTKLALAVFAILVPVSLAGACSSDSSSQGGSASGTRSGASSGSTSGAGSGAASGMSGSVSGSASGAAMGDGGDAGDAGGDDGGEAGDDSAGEAAAAYVPETCTPACMTATGCPTPDCYAASANPIADPATAGVPANLVYPNFAHDGLLNTRYSTGAPGVGVEWFQVDLCRTTSVSGVTLDDSTDPGDQAAAYSVQVSLDGTTWTDVAMAPSVPAATAVLTVTFAPVMARYVRFNQTGMLPTSARTGLNRWWSIDEFSVACPGDGGGADAAPDAPPIDSASEAATASDSSSDVVIDAPGQ